MKLRFRFKARLLLIAVAVVGLVLGASIEWIKRWKRDRYARSEASNIAKAEMHERELAICRAHFGIDPYDLRRADNHSEGYETSFKSWAEEAAWHAGCAEGARKEAARLSELKDFYQRRLLLP